MFSGYFLCYLTRRNLGNVIYYIIQSDRFSHSFPFKKPLSTFRMGDKPMFSFSAHTPSATVGKNYIVPWKKCGFCDTKALVFKSPREFCRHLRDFHCSKEGGSFVCKYGNNGVCPSLPVEGVSDRDYEDHVARDHVAGDGMAKRAIKPDSPGSDLSRDSTPIQTPSTEPSVVQDQYKWSVFMSKVNLPAALNDPRLSRRETDFFTKTWGESFTKTEVPAAAGLPQITREHFRKYLKQTSKRFTEHNQVENSDPRPGDFHTLLTRKLDKHQAEFEQVPKLFLHPGFTLENPDTFNTVFPWQQVESQTGRKQSSKLLQEKLTHYLDVVEVQIARQISHRSEAFFHAMTSHDKLQENMSTTCAAIRKLRDRVQQMDRVMTEGPLKIIKLQKMRSNYVTLHNKLNLMSTVHQTQPTIQLLLATNEFVGALDLISTTQEVLAQELQGLVCFRHLGSQLAELEKLIDKMMQEDFARYANMDLNRPVSEGYSILQEEDFHLSSAQERLVAIILGMIRQHKYNFIDVYKEEVATSLKAVLKQTVIEAVTEVDPEEVDINVQSLADQMRQLNYARWMQLLSRVFENLKIILMRVKAVSEIIQEVLQLASGGRQTRPPTETDAVFSQQSDLTSLGMSDNQTEHISSQNTHSCQSAEHAPPPRISVNTDIDVMISQSECSKALVSVTDMLCSVCDHAHSRCEKLLMARGKDGFLERLNSTEFVDLSRSIEGFVADCEDICGRKSTSLRSCLQSQANKFVNRFHEERKTKLSLILDNERWRQADVPAEFQDLVNHIHTTGSLSLPSKDVERTERVPSEVLLVGEQKFAVAGTVLMLLNMMVEYCQCVEDIPTATPDILTRLIEQLKMFNSRTCQLILGAGALQLVGLKTITTKNLALASRCLQLVVHYIPLVRRHFEGRLQGKQVNMLKHFTHILKDYEDHITELSNKLVAIMDSTFDALLPKWEVRPPMPSVCFRTLCKQITKLHEAICDLLPETQVIEIFERVHTSFKIHLRSQLIKLGVTNDGGPQHGLVMSDVAFYEGSIRALQGLPQILQTSMGEIWDKG